MKSNLFLIGLAISPLLFANETDNQINFTNQQSRQQFNNLQQQKEQLWLNHHRFQDEQKNISNSDLPKVCLPYKKIHFVGFSLIDPSIFAPKTGECINEELLNQITQNITQSYLEKGYIYNPLQYESDYSDWLTLHVKEGKIAKISSSSKRFNIAQILPNSLGNPLKVQELDQALDQANRIPGNDVSVDVLPAKNGEIELVFTNQETYPISGYIGIDNNISKTYKHWQAKTGFSLGNILGLSDTFHFNLNHSLSSQNNFTRSALLYHSIPFGFWTFNSFLSVSQFKSSVQLQNTHFQQNGRTIQAGLGADYTIHRGSNHISSISTQLEQINSKNRFAGEVLSLQSPILTNIQIGWNHLQLFQEASLALDMHYEHGRNKQENQPENKFDKWNITLQFSRYQQIANQLFQHRHQLTGQYSLDYLPSIKQEDLTSIYRVRGFDNLNSSAEKNLVLQNTLSWLITKNNWQVSPYIGIDFGLQKATTPDAHTERALGYVTGINLNSINWNITAQWGKGKFYTGVDSPHKEHSFYFSASYKF